MRKNETVIRYAGIDQHSSYTVRLYESSVDFTHRDFFSHKHSDFEFSSAPIRCIVLPIAPPRSPCCFSTCNLSRD